MSELDWADKLALELPERWLSEGNTTPSQVIASALRSAYERGRADADAELKKELDEAQQLGLELMRERDEARECGRKEALEKASALVTDRRIYTESSAVDMVCTQIIDAIRREMGEEKT